MKMTYSIRNACPYSALFSKLNVLEPCPAIYTCVGLSFSLSTVQRRPRLVGQHGVCLPVEDMATFRVWGGSEEESSHIGLESSSADLGIVDEVFGVFGDSGLVASFLGVLPLK